MGRNSQPKTSVCDVSLMMREAAIPPPPRPPVASRVLASPAGGSHWTTVYLDCAAPARSGTCERERVDGNRLGFRVADDAAETPSVNTADMIRIPGGTVRHSSDKH
jgi:hypothetical protein